MLYFQDPYFSDSYTLHEALISSCPTAIGWKGAYAFASKSGIETLLKDEAFDLLLERGKCSLIVGIDEITNLASLEALKSIKAARPKLTVRAFDNNNRGSLFHPKLSYFENQDGTGTLIVGSGNLTRGGVCDNREAFTLLQLSVNELQRVEQYWNSWLTHANEYLKEIDNPDVIRKARDNQYRRTRIIIPEEIENGVELSTEWIDEIEIFSQDGMQFYPDSEVLLAEIPRASGRWSQANFNIDTFRDFFGVTPGDNSQIIRLQNMTDDLPLPPIETRQSVSVSSQNYRFELAAASGLPYPNAGRPIGIFVKITTRMFLYHLYMPGDLPYATIENWLETNCGREANGVRRITSRAGTINCTV